MEGFLKITADEGMTVECRLKHVGKFDKMFLLKGFTQALEMDPDEVMDAMLLIGIVDKVREGLSGKLDDDDFQEEESSEPQITQAKFDIGAIEKLYGKKKDQQEDF